MVWGNTTDLLAGFPYFAMATSWSWQPYFISTLRSVIRMIAQMGSAALAGFLYEINPASPFCLAALAWIIAFINLQMLARDVLALNGRR